MVDTLHLLPPSLGPQSDPLLFGVTQALEAMFPLAEADRSRFLAMADRLDEDSGDSDLD